MRRPGLLRIATALVASTLGRVRELETLGEQTPGTRRSASSRPRTSGATSPRSSAATTSGVTSIIRDPEADPHLYESNAADAAALADADLVILNGLGYDDAIDKLLSGTSKSGRAVLTVADVLDVHGGADANPHLWYDVPRIPEVAQAIVERLATARPGRPGRVRQPTSPPSTPRCSRCALAIDDIKAKYPRAPVAYTERVPEYLLAAAGLDVKTPPGFAAAIEEGNEPSARDTQAMNDLMSGHGSRCCCTTPRRRAGSPRTCATWRVAMAFRSSRSPRPFRRASPTTQSWQLHQLQALLAALGG